MTPTERIEVSADGETVAAACATTPDLVHMADLLGAFPDHLDLVESVIIHQIITDALARGWAVSVFDGTEYALDASTDPASICAEVAATDTTSLTFWDRAGAGSRVGMVFLVHGNGVDVISDHTDVAPIHDLLRRAETLAERAGG